MKKTQSIILVLATFLIVNCSPQLTVDSVAATATSQPAVTMTPDIKPSETATSTVTPTNAPTISPIITWTPLPTLSAQEKHAKIQELLETNNGCKLPCWWGLVPGKTTWSEAIHFLTPTIAEVKELGGNKEVYYEIDDASEQERLMFDVSGNDRVDWISTYQPETFYTYQLHQVLTLLGHPEQVYISARSTGGDFETEFPPAILVLDYTQIGVWASYGYLPARSGENISICPQDFDKTTSVYELYRTVGGRLELFDPSMENHWAAPMIEVIGAYVDNTWGPETISKLEDATNMTTESFYNTFIDPASKACLETPANLWP
jgi:hypothetical protein